MTYSNYVEQEMKKENCSSQPNQWRVTCHVLLSVCNYTTSLVMLLFNAAEKFLTWCVNKTTWFEVLFVFFFVISTKPLAWLHWGVKARAHIFQKTNLIFDLKHVINPLYKKTSGITSKKKANLLKCCVVYPFWQPLLFRNFIYAFCCDKKKKFKNVKRIPE